ESGRLHTAAPINGSIRHSRFVGPGNTAKPGWSFQTAPDQLHANSNNAANHLTIPGTRLVGVMFGDRREFTNTLRALNNEPGGECGIIPQPACPQEDTNLA